MHKQSTAPNIDCLKSVVKNKALIEEVREEEFAFKGKELVYTLNPEWWSTLESILPVFLDMKHFMDSLQDPSATLAKAAEIFLTTGATITQKLINLAPGDRRVIEASYKKRLAMVFPCLLLVTLHFYFGFSGGDPVGSYGQYCGSKVSWKTLGRRLPEASAGVIGIYVCGCGVAPCTFGGLFY